MASENYPVQQDCVWVASDRGRHVVAFVTAGVGPIPSLVLDKTESLGVTDIEEAILRLPKVSACRLIASVARPDSFISLAERGFFVYDWSDVHRATSSLINAYEMVARPVNPVFLEALPESLRARASSVRFAAAAFADCGTIKVTDYFECQSASQSD